MELWFWAAIGIMAVGIIALLIKIYILHAGIGNNGYKYTAQQHQQLGNWNCYCAKQRYPNERNNCCKYHIGK